MAKQMAKQMEREFQVITPHDITSRLLDCNCAHGVIVGLLQFGLGTQFYLLVSLYLLLQALDGNLLVPLIFSETLKLHPVVIILAVFIFGSMFGFWGVFFSIPIATFIKAVWNAWPSSLE